MSETVRLITIEAFGLTEGQAEALFDRVAEAAHSLNERVTVGMRVLPKEEHE